MRSRFVFRLFSCAIVLISTVGASRAVAVGLPGDPTDPNHPGSRIYPYTTFTETQLTCSGRDVTTFIPSPVAPGETFPVVVFGHGQALGLDNDRKTFEHLARKGIASVFPKYDNGFFDRDWTRMGRDYVTVAACAIQATPAMDPNQVVFSGHSKGAYVASIAAGLAFKEKLAILPKAAILFEAAGADPATLKAIDSSVLLTVVFSDADTTVKRSLSDTIFNDATSAKKQFIYLKSYAQTTPTLTADHFWTLTKGSMFGGTGESALHTHSMWKWLGGVAYDVRDQSNGTNSYAYGADAADKGLPGLTDDVTKTW